MKPSNLEILNQSFDVQAPNFESDTVQFSKQDYLDYTLSNIAPNKHDTILEVASGTCICGRFFSPFVRAVVCLDATRSMLQAGKKEADKNHLDNMFFMKGCAEELPFLDNSFDIVFSRLAFHHFTNVNTAFSEMVRVLKPNGKLVMIDMEAPHETLRSIEDKLETLRDPSHVKNLSKDEMQKLFESYGLHIEKCDSKKIEQNLMAWLDLTFTNETAKEKIITCMQEDINGKRKTGFYPFQNDKGICFNQNWVFILGRKSI